MAKKDKPVIRMWRYVDYADPSTLVFVVGPAEPTLPSTASRSSLMSCPLDTPERRRLALDYLGKCNVRNKGKRAAAAAVEALCKGGKTK